MIAAIRRWLAAHHDRRAAAAGAATLAAQQRRDWSAAARHMRDMHAAQARRDAVLTDQPRICCSHNCREGRDCPLRTS